MSSKVKRPKLSIAAKLLICFLSFTGITLLLLWVFQIALLDTFYKNITESRIENHAASIATNIDNDSIYDLATRIVQDGDISIKVIYFSGGTSFDASTSGDSRLLMSLSGSELYRLYNAAEEQGGSCTVTYDRSSFSQSAYNFHDFLGSVPKDRARLSKTLVYVRTVQTSQSSAVIYAAASLYPVNSTVDTLKVQLVCVTAIMILLSLIIALVLSGVISKPIIRLNKSAKVLATADYSTTFSAGSFRELTELSDTLNSAAIELGKVDRLKSELIANISHDLRTPLTLISGYAEMMRDIPGEMCEENLQIIIDETQRLSSLVSDVLDISKLCSGTQTLSPTRFSLTEAVRNIISRYSELVRRSGYRIIFEPEYSIYVYADEIRISQVIYNLITNAVHYTGEDKTVVIRQLFDGCKVRIEVCDSGEGISPEDIKLIWDRYYKVDKDHRRNQIGTGLGLSIVKSVLEQHNADFGVSSEPGKGSVFWFELPGNTE